MDSLAAESTRPVALVTGGTVGIGLAFAEALAARGHDLVLVARDQERLTSVAGRLSTAYDVTVETIAADLADREALGPVEARLTDPTRPVAVLVNNAGYGLKRPLIDNEVADEVRMLDVLVTAVLRLSHAALTSMVERGDGAVINVSSVAAFLPRGTYGAAKAWVLSFGRWADATYRGRGVRVLTVCPGFVRTEFHERMGVSRGSAAGPLWLDPTCVAREALADLERGRTVSIPSRRYRAIVVAQLLIPRSTLSRFQGLGRR